MTNQEWMGLLGTTPQWTCPPNRETEPGTPLSQNEVMRNSSRNLLDLGSLPPGPLETNGGGFLCLPSHFRKWKNFRNRRKSGIEFQGARSKKRRRKNR